MITNFFKPFPTLTTPRLTLRQLSIEDVENVFALRSNKQINKYLDRQESKTLEDALNFINKINDSINKDESIYWAISFKNSKALIGTICLFGFSNEKDTSEIGYELLTNFQNQGIMKEAIEKVIDFAFKVLKLNEIEAFTHHENYSSTKLLLKSGFIKSKEAYKEYPTCAVYYLTSSVYNK